MKIRGTFLKDYVKIIRGTRDKDWEKFLTAQDWEILDSMILPTEWYPGETWAGLQMACSSFWRAKASCS